MERLLADASKISGQEYDISNLSDVYDAIHVIQQEMGVTGTTSKEAAETLSGSFAMMQSSAINFLGALSTGQGVGDALKGMVSSASTFVFDNLVPALLNIAKELPNAAITFVTSAVPSLLSGLAKGLPQIMQSLTGVFGQVTERISEAMSGKGGGSKMLETGKKLLMQVLKGIVKNLPQLLIAAVKLVFTFTKFLISNLPKIIIVGGKLVLALVKGLGGAMLPKVKAAAGKIKDKLIEPITKAKDKIKAILEKIKGFFPLKIGKIFKNMKLPHFVVKGGKAPWGIGGLGTKPTISVKWYAKGGIVDGATLIGAGEKGPEAIVPLTQFWDKIDSIADSIKTNNAEQIAPQDGVLNVVFKVGEEVIGQSAVNYINGQTIQFGASPINV